MPGIRFASVAAVSAVMLGLGMSSAAAGTTSSARAVISGTAGADIAACLAHVPGAVSEDWYDVYTPGCTGHDEPELDPVSPAPRSAQNITWHVQLPADGAFPVSGVGPTFWFGGTVKDANPAKIGQEGFLELQFYPDSFASACTPDGGFSVVQAPDVYTACSPVWTIEQQGQQIDEPAAFNGMLTDARVKAPFVMHARDIVDVHIWAPRPDSPYREQLTDETSGRASSVLVLISPQDGPLTPEFSTQEIGNALDWGGVWDTPMVFVWEIGHSDLYGDHPEEFCVPGQTALGRGLRYRREGRGARQLVRRPHRLHGVRRPVLHLPVVLRRRPGDQLRRGLQGPRGSGSVRADGNLPGGQRLPGPDVLRHDHPLARRARTATHLRITMAPPLAPIATNSLVRVRKPADPLPNGSVSWKACEIFL
jgi:hypothetical protein